MAEFVVIVFVISERPFYFNLHVKRKENYQQRSQYRHIAISKYSVCLTFSDESRTNKAYFPCPCSFHLTP